MNFELNFSQLNLLLDPDKITQLEIRSVIENPNYRFFWLDGYTLRDGYNIICGYSNKKRILLMASYIFNDKCVILQVNVADEEQIKMYYCKS